MNPFGWTLSVCRARARNGKAFAAFLALALLASTPVFAQQSVTAPQAGPLRSEEPIKRLMRVDQTIREQAERELLAEGYSAVPKLLAAVRGDGSRRVVQGVLLKMGPKAIPALIANLDDEQLAIKAGSLLFSVITPASLDQAPVLLDCVAKKPRVNNYCGNAMLKLMGPKAAVHVPAFRKALKASTPESRAFAADALGLIGAASRPAGAELARLVSDSDPRVRFASVQALGRIGGSSPAVRKALQQVASRMDETPEFREQAKKALRRWNE